MKFDLNTILLVVAIVLLTLLLRGCGRTPVNNDYLKTIKAKDDTIAAVVSQRNQERLSKDSAITVLLRKDTSDQKKFIQTVTKYEKIPVYVRSLSKDSLRAAATRQ